MNRTKKEIAAYQAAALKIITDLGAVPLENNVTSYSHTINTKGRALWISIGDDCCICTRFFDHVEARKLGLGDRLNIYSGKWNWMGGNDHAEDMLDLAHFHAALRKIVKEAS